MCDLLAKVTTIHGRVCVCMCAHTRGWSICVCMSMSRVSERKENERGKQEGVPSAAPTGHLLRGVTLGQATHLHGSLASLCLEHVERFLS